jgi:CBS domain-containing protein
MQTAKVKQLATPLAQYTSVPDNACLKDAILAMEKALQGEGQTDPNRPRDFAVLVVDKEGEVKGRLTIWDILQGLEVNEIRPVDPLSMVEDFNIWSRPLSHLAAKARYVQVRNLVKGLPKGEFIDEEASLDKAIHRLLTQRALSLIVTRQKKPIGLLRIVDVFHYLLEQARKVSASES